MILETSNDKKFAVRDMHFLIIESQVHVYKIVTLSIVRFQTLIVQYIDYSYFQTPFFDFFFLAAFPSVIAESSSSPAGELALRDSAVSCGLSGRG